MEGGVCVKRVERKGYSLVELMIAMTITVFVLAGLLALLGYGTNNVRITQSVVALQNKAKDATNHISTYTMEASEIAWDEDEEILIVTKKDIVQEQNADGTYPDPKVETYYYWKDQDADHIGGIYFARRDKVIDPSDATKVILNAAPDFLLVDDIEDFKCEVEENDDTGKKILHMQLKLKNQLDEAEFECKKDVYMRNQ